MHACPRLEIQFWSAQSWSSERALLDDTSRKLILLVWHFFVSIKLRIAWRKPNRNPNPLRSQVNPACSTYLYELTVKSQMITFTWWLTFDNVGKMRCTTITDYFIYIFGRTWSHCHYLELKRRSTFHCSRYQSTLAVHYYNNVEHSSTNDRKYFDE